MAADSSVPEIEESFEIMEEYPSVVERYYSPFYYLNEGGSPLEHHCVLFHSNRVCLITLAPSHPVIKECKKVVKLDFQVSSKVDRLDNKVTGKGKKGAQHIQPQSLLCFVDCYDGTRYPVFGSVKGKLIEINDNLILKPELLTEKPSSEGFIAIILPNIRDIEEQKEKLITREQYQTFLTSCKDIK